MTRVHAFLLERRSVVKPARPSDTIAALRWSLPRRRDARPRLLQPAASVAAPHCRAVPLTWRTWRCSSSIPPRRSRSACGSAAACAPRPTSSSPAAASGPGLIFSTMLAANIGAGSTVGATGLGYRDGLAGCGGSDRRRSDRSPWRCGSARRSAGLPPSTISAPSATSSSTASASRCGRRLPRCCGSARSSSWPGSSSPSPRSSNAIVGVPSGARVRDRRPAHHDLLHRRRPAHVGVGQRGPAHGEADRLCARAAAGAVGGRRLAAPSARCSRRPTTGHLWQGGHSGVVYLAMLGPAFVVSPGLLQKIYGARDDRAVRLGVGAQRNRAGALCDGAGGDGHDRAAAVPGLCRRRSMRCRRCCCTACRRSSARIGLAAVFSAELSAADAVLFMLTTSLSQDFYKRFVQPRGATDAQVLRVTRITAVVAGALGVLVAILAADVVDALTHLLHADGGRPVRADPCRPLHPTAASTARARRHRLRRDRRRRRAVRRRACGIKGFTPAMLGLLGSVRCYVVVRRSRASSFSFRLPACSFEDANHPNART